MRGVDRSHTPERQTTPAIGTRTCAKRWHSIRQRDAAHEVVGLPGTMRWGVPWAVDSGMLRLAPGE